MRRYWIEDLKNWENFSYLTLRGVPMKRSKSGGAIDFDLRKIEKLVARAIIENQIPICGLELAFLRRTVKLSLEKFGNKLGLSHGAVFPWEKSKKQRLSPAYEIAVKLLCAEELGFELNASFSNLLGDPRNEALEVMVTNKKASSKERKVRIEMRPSYRGHRRVEVREPE